jgi:hypothetical protein
VVKEATALLMQREMKGIRVEKERSERLRIAFHYNKRYITGIKEIGDISGILRVDTGVFLTPVMFLKEFYQSLMGGRWILILRYISII